jgi:predicted N-acetyltransferase YhbS
MDHRAMSAVSSPSVTQRSLRSRVRLPVIRAEGSDLSAIYYFLQTVLQGPSAAEFNAATADPFYEPCDRLLLRRERRIVAHVHTTHRQMHLGPVQVPVEGLGWLGVASEHRNQGLGAYLLQAAENQMQRNGALLGLLRTSIPRFFRRTGWAMCGQASYRRVDARALLARLLDRGLTPRPRHRLQIRPWLQWEQAALMRIYNQNVMPAANDASDSPQMLRNALRLRLRETPCNSVRQHGPGALAAGAVCSFGPLERTEAYWDWLLKRRAYDQIYVALEGPELLELGEISTHVVGYAVTRGEQILELMTAPERPRVATELLARCCGDAIEHDRHCVLLHGPLSCPLFEIFDEAGGCGPLPQPSEHSQVHMMRLLDPPKLLRRMIGEFDRRTAESRLPRQFDLGLLVDGQKYQLEFGQDGIGVTSNRIGRSYLRLNVADFTRLVLGQLDWNAALADGRLECSTALAAEAGRVLFPAIPLWRPPWDDSPSLDDWAAAK